MSPRRKVRVSQGQTMSQVYAMLTRRQRDDLRDVRTARADLGRVEAAFGAAQARLYAEIHDALADGVPAKMLAEELEVSVSRIYQIHDEVEGYRREAD